MNKTDFIAQLSVKLRERGIEEEVILRHIAKLEQYAPELLVEIEDLDLIADEISILLKKRAESHNNTEPDSSAEAQEDSENIALPLSSQPENNSEQPLEENPGESADAEPVDDTLDGAEPIEAAPFDDTSVNDTPIDDTPDDAEPVGTGGNVGVDNSPDETPPGDVTSVEPDSPPPASEQLSMEQNKLSEYDEELAAPGPFAAIKAFFSPSRKKELTEAERKGNRIFWTFFFLSLLITLPLSLGILLLFGAAYLFLFALIVALLGSLIIVAAGGTALALIGIIYGLTQLLKSVPIGLYEIGFGVILGGVAMFSGIIIYNIALRLIPFTIKKLTVFFAFVCRQAKRLFILAKGACAKL